MEQLECYRHKAGTLKYFKEMSEVRAPASHCIAIILGLEATGTGIVLG
jgi:hypothetical protein